MDGKELLERVISTIQEMYLKLGDPEGAVSLYYPFEGDTRRIEEEFAEAVSSEGFHISLEFLGNRLRLLVPESECVRISALPAKRTMADLVGLAAEHADVGAYRQLLDERYPDARLVRSGYVDFDWILVFPEDLDTDVYCLTEEFGTVTFHRFSREEYLALGFALPRNDVRFN